MNQEKIGNFIKKIRLDNHLTQKELANLLGVTYQAVSKWENGKNVPDIGILKQMSEEFDVNIDEIISGEKKDVVNVNNTNSKIKLIAFIGSVIVLLLIIVLIVTNRNNDFQFKTISSNCSDFKITGSAAYNKDKTAIYISSIEFCGKNSNEKYKKIECSLYENYDNLKGKISSCTVKHNINLVDYLKDVKINVDNYSYMCNKLTSNTLSLEILATDQDNNIVTYLIPIKLNDNCN